MRRVVVVGASLAGLNAVESLREAGYEREIIMLSAEEHLPYDRPPLSKEGLLAGIDADKLALRPPGWVDSMGVDLRLGTRASALDPQARQVLVDGGESLDYDGLVIATGASARTLPTAPGAPKAHVLRNIQDAVALRAELEPGRRLAVIGAGFIGLEVAATARQLGLEVTVVEVAQTPLSRVLGDDVGTWFRDLHERNGVRVICSCTVERLEQHGEGARFALSSGESFDVDVVVAGIGAVPNTAWLESSGIELGNGVVCEEDLSTSLPGVVAAGDLALWYNATFDEAMRVEHWTNAVEQGRQAGLTLAGHRSAYAAVPYFWSDQHDARIRFVGRSGGADQVVIPQSDDQRMVALYGRDGVIIGAVCVNAPRQLARFRQAISDRVAWSDVLAEVGPPAPGTTPAQ